MRENTTGILQITPYMEMSLRRENSIGSPQSYEQLNCTGLSAVPYPLFYSEYIPVRQALGMDECEVA